jgi:hypothetical protein
MGRAALRSHDVDSLAAWQLVLYVKFSATDI